MLLRDITPAELAQMSGGARTAHCQAVLEILRRFAPRGAVIERAGMNVKIWFEPTDGFTAIPSAQIAHYDNRRATYTLVQVKHQVFIIREGATIRLADEDSAQQRPEEQLVSIVRVFEPNAILMGIAQLPAAMARILRGESEPPHPPIAAPQPRI